MSTIISSPLKACMLFQFFIPMFFWCEYIFGNLLVVWHKNIEIFFGGRGDGNLGGFFSHKFIFAKIVELIMIFFSFFFVCFSRLFTTSLLFFYTFVHLHKRIIMASRALSARRKSRVYYIDLHSGIMLTHIEKVRVSCFLWICLWKLGFRFNFKSW